MNSILAQSKYVSPIMCFVQLGYLSTIHLQRWKTGSVPYLEAVLRCNLGKANRVLRLMRFHAHDLNLKPSPTVYLRSKGKTIAPSHASQSTMPNKHQTKMLRFSKSGDAKIETAYALSFVITGTTLSPKPIAYHPINLSLDSGEPLKTSFSKSS